MTSKSIIDQCLVSSHQRPNIDSKTFKRKSDETLERASKSSRTSLSPSDDVTSLLEFISSSKSNSFIIITASSRSGGRNSSKRKSEKTEGPRKRSRKTLCPSETSSNQTSCDVAYSSEPGTSPSANSSDEDDISSHKPRTSSSAASSNKDGIYSNKPGRSHELATCRNHRADFEAKYAEEQKLGEGGFGQVYAGYRREDNLPVAIKHICPSDVKRKLTLLDGRYQRVPLEVILMLRANPSASSTSAAISLLDWYDLRDELILVLERPVPCMDLHDYIMAKDMAVPETEAKIITKQLVHALLEIHSRGVFHNDLKLQNVLVETASDVPRARIIDFGCGTFFSEDLYTRAQGTTLFTSPEWFLEKSYRAEPATVWQLGMTVYTMMHKHYPFRNRGELIDENPNLSCHQLSFNCNDFILNCLQKNPEHRASLQTLADHAWLR